jgi:biopolymer transport protein ExbB
MQDMGLFQTLPTLRSIGLAILVGLFGMSVFSTPVQAFQDEAADETTEPVEDGAVDDAGDGDDGDDAGDDVGVTEQRNFLTWMIEASGTFGLLILLLSFIMVALIMMNILQVRRDNFVPQAFVESFEQRLNAKDYQGAYETARADESLVARVLAAGLSKLNQGYDKAVEGMQEVGDDENMALEHRLSYLALISAVDPMLGLMGTVSGMIATFRVIANSSTTPKPAELAEGISSALFTTLEGLTVAIPAMVFYAILRNRIARFTLEVGMVSEGLMGRFAQAGKTPPAAPPKPAGGAAPAGTPAAPQE